MPIDQYEDDEAKGATGVRVRFKEFDCPSCNANNPCDPPFGDDDELLCNYCGCQYKVKISDEGRLRLRAI